MWVVGEALLFTLVGAQVQLDLLNYRIIGTNMTCSSYLVNLYPLYISKIFPYFISKIPILAHTASNEKNSYTEN